MALFLIGGGWDTQVVGAHYRTFLAAARGDEPTVACVVVDEGDGEAQVARWADALAAAGPCRPVPVLVPLGGSFDVASLDGADAVLVCGGLTPAYASALAPAAAAVRAWLADGDKPYAGFSAGAAVAAGRAVVGGWRSTGVPVCPEDAGEDLDEVTVADGLGLVPFAVDVHCAQWGTLGRLAAAVTATGRPGVALDEGTMLAVTRGLAVVSGSGHAWTVAPTDGGAVIRMLAAGASLVVDR
ncbi:MAG TPA: peptidase S51 [Actinotalea sp.]